MRQLEKFIEDYIGDPAKYGQQNSSYMKLQMLLFNVHRKQLQKDQIEEIAKTGKSSINNGKAIDDEYVVESFTNKGYSTEFEWVIAAIRHRNDLALINKFATSSLRDDPNLVQKLNSIYSEIESTWHEYGSRCFYYAGEKKNRPIGWQEEDSELLREDIHLQVLYNVMRNNAKTWNGDELSQMLHDSMPATKKEPTPEKRYLSQVAA
jgi:hypothetical protein